MISTGLLNALTNPDLITFSVALTLVTMLVVLELLSALVGFSLLGSDSDASIDLDLDADLDLDLDLDSDLDLGPNSGVNLDLESNFELSPDATDGQSISTLHSALAFLGIGKVPFGVWLLAFLSLFGVTGLILQQIIHSLIDYFVPWLIAVPLVFIGISPVLSKFCSVLGRMVPSIETSAIGQQSLISKSAKIVQGTARFDLPAQAKVIDKHGNPHYVRVAPRSEDEEFPQGTNVRLVSVENGVFRALKLRNT